MGDCRCRCCCCCCCCCCLQNLQVLESTPKRRNVGCKPVTKVGLFSQGQLSGHSLCINFATAAAAAASRFCSCGRYIHRCCCCRQLQCTVRLRDQQRHAVALPKTARVTQDAGGRRSPLLEQMAQNGRKRCPAASKVLEGGLGGNGGGGGEKRRSNGETYERISGLVVIAG